MARAAHGCGPAAALLRARTKKGRRLARWLLPYVQQREATIQRTGDLFPRGNMKKVKVRRMFSPWLHKTGNVRYFTKPVTKCAVEVLLGSLSFVPPRKPGERWDKYVACQAARLHELGRAAKKSSLRVQALNSKPRSLFVISIQNL